MPLRLHPDVVTADSDDGTVLLHQRTGRYWQLNGTGSHVLRQLLDGRSPEQVAADLAGRHRVDLHRTSRDVTAVVDHLRASGLVVV
ncbi:lasso peptide biosynthesis PqqD family chaperone [Saccharopolyspora erythraea]|uniref:lasso peptide biosynthesis PqqD family chaperone n=1 Tax=Saccharopolyspora erythraea TaxID=1836 RepID=UPI001BADD1BB|nr:lasso peptide biosynthesis PqqD family chaperone [Saccharopolyspora erythraea]QUH00860.1 lasso peptide biosynthesis PqqD family chaperone [Saccharopolyspora erythraea]